LNNLANTGGGNGAWAKEKLKNTVVETPKPTSYSSSIGTSYNSQGQKSTSGNTPSNVDIKVDWTAPINPGNFGDFSGTVVGVGNALNLYDKFRTDGFNVSRNGNVAIINGARTPSAIEEGINGTRYTINNASKNPAVWKYVDPKAAVQDAFNVKNLGTKIGYAGIVVDTANDFKGDYSQGGISRAAAGITVNVGVGLSTMAAGAYLGAAVGSVVPGVGTVVGAGVGLAVGVGVSLITNTTINGKSVKNHMKDGVQFAYDKIGEGAVVAGKSIASNATQSAKAVVNVINKAADSTVGKAVISGVTKIAEKAVEGAKAVGNTVKKTEQAIVATVNKNIKAVVSGTTQSVKVVSNTVKSTAKAVVSTASDVGKAVVAGTTKAVTSMESAMHSAYSSFSSSYSYVSNTVQSAASTTTKAVVSTVTDVGKAVTAGATKAASKVGSFLKKLF
jgi:hypothetical protein